MRDMNSNRRTELAGFLRARRARLSPRQAGLPEAGTPNRRRTPGLRRQEVAQLAGLSVDYYIRLEQARGRSEEHTSELQSRRDLVCRLLLEKKKENRRAILDGRCCA